MKERQQHRAQGAKALNAHKAFAAYEATDTGRSSGTMGAFRRPAAGAPRARNLRNGSAGVAVGFTPGQLTHDPRLALSYLVRAARRFRPLPVCTVYDAVGKPIATINPVTRERTPL